MLEPVIEKGNNEITIDTIKQRALAGDNLIVLVTKEQEIIAVMTLETRTFDSGHKALYVPICSGKDLEQWGFQFFEYCQMVAKEYGINEIRAIGREGWLRKMNSAGLHWRKISETIACKVE